MLKKSMDTLERIKPEAYAQKYQNGTILILDNIRSAFNVGSIFRTADCFGIYKIFLCGITCKTDNRELQKTALGAEISVPSEYFSTTIEAIQSIQNEYHIIAVEQTNQSKMLDEYAFDHSKNIALVFGNEVDGVDLEVLNRVDEVLEIPQIGSKHSLNVANSSSIVIWDMYNKRKTN
jgi:tRNA G18 (ribose-2'-O)-methylase SpoU